MSQSTNPSSSSTAGGGNWRRRRVDKQRGIPKFCRCGEEAVIKTSGTVKNPGRLFYCCPNGSEGDKYHLFTWTDERLVEEVEDLKSLATDLKSELSDVKVDVAALEKQLEHTKVISEMARNACCSIL